MNRVIRRYWLIVLVALILPSASEMLAEFDGRGAHGGDIGAAEGEHAGQDGDDLGPGGSAQGEGES